MLHQSLAATVTGSKLRTWRRRISCSSNLVGQARRATTTTTDGNNSVPLLFRAANELEGPGNRSQHDDDGWSMTGCSAASQPKAKMSCSLIGGGGSSRGAPNSGLLPRRVGSASPKQGGRLVDVAIACSSLLIVILLIVSANISSNKGSGQVLAQSSPATAATNAYGDPIKWSFGGWAPLDGQQPGGGGGGRRNQTFPGGSATSPLPAMNSISQRSSTVAAPGQHQQQQKLHHHAMLAAKHQAARNQSARSDPSMAAMAMPLSKERLSSEHMNASASIAHGKVHFAAPQQKMGPFGSNGGGSNYNRQGPQSAGAAAHPILSGPAYALPIGQAATHFSPPAPSPIIRDHLLPSGTSANYQQQQQQSQYLASGGNNRGRSFGPHHMPRVHSQPMNEMHHQQQQHMRPPMSMQEHQRRLEHEHRRQMMRHHQMMMQQHHQMNGHQQHRPGQPNMARYPQMMQQHPQQQQQQQQYHQQQQQHHQQQQHQQQQQQQQQQHQQQQRPAETANVGAFRVVEGEHPIIFTHPAAAMDAEHMVQPMMELTGSSPGRNHTHQPQAGSSSTSAAAAAAAGGQEPYSSSTLAANERDNLNYQSALRQVSSTYAPNEQHSNNIQDIKQQQQQQAAAAAGKGEHRAHKSGSYLTIPVAVETEGDKVLTADDINEIEKHVIKVLPNLKTADKVVKLADTKLTLASGNLKIGPHSGDAQATSSTGPAAIHELNYEEHRTTMKALENDLLMGSKPQYSQPPQQQQQPQSQQYGGQSSPLPSSTTGAYSSGGGAGNGPPTRTTGPAMNQATTNAHAQHQKPIQGSAGGGDDDDAPEHQYFLATGPMQEVGTVDPDQIAEYNLIKNDLLHNFHYEPTRAASPSASSSPASQQQQNQNQHNQQQSGSTPPMPYTASQPQQQQQQQQPAQQHQSQPQLQQQQHRPAGVTRYFQQGNSFYQQNDQQSSQRPLQQQQQHMRNNYQKNLFGRINTPRGYGSGGGGTTAMAAQAQPQHQQQQQTASTKTILGGRKVSDVMRNLIHTTPVPMTSPMHVPSVEPEKVDAIQLIASHGNDKQPMVVEAHQLVHHTPDGGFDYNSGGMNNNNNNNHSHNHIDQGQQQQQQQQYGNSVQEHANANGNIGGGSGDNQGGAIIEYVAVNEQQLNGALGQHEGTYEIAGQPDVQPVYASVDEQQHQQTSSSPTSGGGGGGGGGESSVQPAGYSMGPPTEQQQQQPQPMFTWSPSIANEHQQQQAELSEHAAPVQQMDMPATAGYNFFGQQQSNADQPTNSGGAGETNQPGQEYEQQQQQQYQEQHSQGQGAKWRTKAGGSQPNPDAQYDGQIAKGAGDHESNQGAQNSQQQESEQDRYAGYNRGQEQQQQSGPEPAHLTDGQHHQGDTERGGADGYQKQQQQQQQQPYQQQQQPEQTQTTQANQQSGDGYLATNSFSAGAQFNHQTPSHGNYERQEQQYDQSRQQPAHNGLHYDYVKLDHDRQQSHLAQQQAQRQAELMNSNNNQQAYQTTTPMTMTTVASIDHQEQQQQQQQQQQVEDHNQQQQQQQEQQSQSDYGREQSLPSVQSSPDSMLVNESPMNVPILDQQSLIPDSNQDSNQGLGQEMSSDDGAKQEQPTAVYQVYQAYYAPKDHKPLPGYVRLSLEEFNELFRDAEIQYVDRNLNGLVDGGRHGSQQASNSQHDYEHPSNGQTDMMKASASELNQSIVVDRRSITSERRSSNATESADSANLPQRKLKIGGAVKKIISVRNSRQAARQQLKDAKQLRLKTQRPDLDVASSTISPSFLNPVKLTTIKQQPTVLAAVNKNHNQKSTVGIISKQDKSSTKRKVDSAKKAPALVIADAQPVKLSKNKPDRMILSAADSRRNSSAIVKSGSKTSR